MRNPGHYFLSGIISLIVFMLVSSCLPTDRVIKPEKDNLHISRPTPAPAVKVWEEDQIVAETDPYPELKEAAGTPTRVEVPLLEEKLPAQAMAGPAPDHGGQIGTIAPAASRPHSYPDEAGMVAGDVTIDDPYPYSAAGMGAGKSASVRSYLGQNTGILASVPVIPKFPWPPPKTSATTEIPDKFFRNNKNDALIFAQVDEIIRKALDNSGYYERSYFAVPDGFALVTRLENINPDGTPKSGDDRWVTGTDSIRSFSLETYLKALFTSNPGFFRIVVFVITPHPFTQNDTIVSRVEATAWINLGLNKLPHKISSKPYTDRFSCTALIYEFEKIAGEQVANTVIPGKLPGRTHLERSELWEGLQR